jgi:hypothetical protein
MKAVHVFLCAVVCLLLLVPTFLFSQDSLNVSLMGRWAYGPSYGVMAVGSTSYFYLGTGGYFQVYDGSAPSSPSRIGYVALPEPLEAIAIAGDTAYVADGESGLIIVDLSTPSSPTIVGQVDFGGNALDVVVNGSYAYVADGTGNLRVIDIWPSTSPSLYNTHSGLGGEPCGIVYSWNHVYVISKDESVTINNYVRVFDISDPSNINAVDTYTGVYRPRDLALFGTDLYVADSTGIRSVDVTSLASPSFVTNDYFDFGKNSVAVALDTVNDIAYTVAGDSLCKVDISTPSSLSGATGVTIGATGYDISLDLTGDYAYVPVGLEGYRNFDISGSPPTADYDNDPGYGLTRDVVVLGTTAFIADGDDGLYEIDISTPSAPVAVDSNYAHFASCTATGLDIEGSNLFVASGSEGLKIYDVSDINTLVGSYNTSGNAYNVFLDDTIAYIADGTNGLVILDVSDPTTPALIQTYDSFSDPGDVAKDVKVVSDTAYIAVAYEGLWIVDVRDPSNPQYVGHRSMAGEVYAVAVDVLSKYAYIADGTDGLRIVDVEPATSPNIINTVTTSGTVRDVAVNGNYAYLADGTGGLRVVNIMNPLAAYEVGYYDTGDDAYGVFVMDYYLYLADYEDGLFILDNLLAHPTHFTTAEGYNVVDPSGKAITVLIESSVVRGKDASGIQAGDEFAVFNGDTIVGRAVYEGIFPVPINVWMRYIVDGDHIYDGAWENDKMILKVWNQSTDDVLGGFPIFASNPGGVFSSSQLLTRVSNLVSYQLEGFDNGMAPVHPSGYYQWIQFLYEDSILINNNVIQDGDEIAIYAGSLCVGAFEWDGVYMGLPAWYEHTLGDGDYLPGAVIDSTMRFRVWRQSNGNFYWGIPTYQTGYTGGFGEDTTLVRKLESFTDTTQNTIVEPNRLNLISFFVKPRDAGDRDIGVMLQYIETLEICWDDSGHSYIPGTTPTINEIGQVDFTNGYYLYYSSADTDTVVVEGFVLMAEDYTLTLDQDRIYMIGFPYANPHYVVQVFGTIRNYVYILQDDEGLVWIPWLSTPINTIDLNGGLQPGKGYRIYLTNPITDWRFPTLDYFPKSVSSPRPPGGSLQDMSPKHFTFAKTGLPYAVILTDSETPLKIGDEIGLYADGMCVGAGIFTGDYPVALTAWEKLNMNGIQVDGFTRGQAISLRIWNSDENHEYKVLVSADGNMSAAYGSGPLSLITLDAFDRVAALPEYFDLKPNYPNPFNPETTIPYQLPEAAHVRLVIYNTLGQKIRTLVNENKEAGFYSAPWDGRDDRGIRVGSGIYIVKMKAGEYSKIHKMTMIQ